MALAGLDVGTSGCKFTIMDEQGQILGTAYHSYEAIREGATGENKCLSIPAASNTSSDH